MSTEILNKNEILSSDEHEKLLALAKNPNMQDKFSNIFIEENSKIKERVWLQIKYICKDGLESKNKKDLISLIKSLILLIHYTDAKKNNNLSDFENKYGKLITQKLEKFDDDITQLGESLLVEEEEKLKVQKENIYNYGLELSSIIKTQDDEFIEKHFLGELKKYEEKDKEQKDLKNKQDENFEYISQNYNSRRLKVSSYDTSDDFAVDKNKLKIYSNYMTNTVLIQNKKLSQAQIFLAVEAMSAIDMRFGMMESGNDYTVSIFDQIANSIIKYIDKVQSLDQSDQFLFEIQTVTDKEVFLDKMCNFLSCGNAVKECLKGLEFKSPYSISKLSETLKKIDIKEQNHKTKNKIKKYLETTKYSPEQSEKIAGQIYQLLKDVVKYSSDKNLDFSIVFWKFVEAKKTEIDPAIFQLFDPNHKDGIKFLLSLAEDTSYDLYDDQVAKVKNENKISQEDLIWDAVARYKFLTNGKSIQDKSQLSDEIYAIYRKIEFQRKILNLKAVEKSDKKKQKLDEIYSQSLASFDLDDLIGQFKKDFGENTYIELDKSIVQNKILNYLEIFEQNKLDESAQSYGKIAQTANKACTDEKEFSAFCNAYEQSYMEQVVQKNDPAKYNHWRDAKMSLFNGSTNIYYDKCLKAREQSKKDNNLYIPDIGYNLYENVGINQYVLPNPFYDKNDKNSKSTFEGNICDINMGLIKEFLKENSFDIKNIKVTPDKFKEIFGFAIDRPLTKDKLEKITKRLCEKIRSKISMGSDKLAKDANIKQIYNQLILNPAKGLGKYFHCLSLDNSGQYRDLGLRTDYIKKEIDFAELFDGDQYGYIGLEERFESAQKSMALI